MMVEVSDKLLKAFKERMRIFYDVEDDNLRRILAGSQAALSERFGVAVDVIDSGQELILEIKIKLQLFFFQALLKYFLMVFQIGNC